MAEQAAGRITRVSPSAIEMNEAQEGGACHCNASIQRVMLLAELFDLGFNEPHIGIVSAGDSLHF